MTNERLYQLAHEALETKWYNAHKKLEAHPNNSTYRRKEKELWNELKELETEMWNKGYMKE